MMRADCCNARAMVKATLTSGRTILFCQHHADAHCNDAGIIRVRPVEEKVMV